ncbi:MAG: hypothetical protein WA809_01315 [Candidatus Dormiibacterota bacterium]
MMGKGRVKSALALVGACAALSIVVPPLAGLLNGVGSLTLLAMGGYAAYRAWAWLEAVVEASRRPTTVRRNLNRSDPGDDPPPPKSRSRAPAKVLSELEPVGEAEHKFRWPRVVRPARSYAEPSRDR